MAKPLDRMSATEIEKAYDRALATLSGVNRELIGAGRGHEKCRETLEKTDPLALRYREASNAFDAVVQEQRARKAWHGSLKPIRRKAA